MLYRLHYHVLGNTQKQKKKKRGRSLHRLKDLASNELGVWALCYQFSRLFFCDFHTEESQCPASFKRTGIDHYCIPICGCLQVPAECSSNSLHDLILHWNIYEYTSIYISKLKNPRKMYREFVKLGYFIITLYCSQLVSKVKLSP
jgi:hypothetical protein